MHVGRRYIAASVVAAAVAGLGASVMARSARRAGRAQVDVAEPIDDDARLRMAERPTVDMGGGNPTAADSDVDLRHGPAHDPKSIAAAANRLASAIRAHLGVLISVAVFAAVAGRLWQVSGENTITLRALVQTTPAPIIFVGTLAPIVAPLALLLSIGVLLWVIGHQLSDSGLTAWSAVRAAVWSAAAIVLTSLFESFSPPPGARMALEYADAPALITFALIAVNRPVAAIVRLGGRRPSVTRVRIPVSKSIRTVGELAFVIVGCLALVYGVVDAQPWMPPERFRLADGSMIIGYVLQRDGDDLVVLREGDRLVERVAEDDIEARAYCTTIAQGPDGYQPCDL